MGFFTCERFDSFDLVFLDQITDLYTGEFRLMNAFPRMAKAASDARLQAEFRSHLHEVPIHARRLERIFDAVNLHPVRVKHDPIKGLIAEVEKVIKAHGTPAVIDAALIGALHRIEQYHIAAYRTALTFAQRIDRPEIVRLLQATLAEKRRANQNLAELAEYGNNLEADAVVSEAQPVRPKNRGSDPGGSVDVF